MSHVTDDTGYRLALGVSNEALIRAVNSYLDRGYQLYGSPFFNERDGFYCQAVIKQGVLKRGES